MSTVSRSQPIRVLQSFRTPRPTTNPYISMLSRALQEEPGIELLHFSFRTALLGRYDVLHLHWPEVVVGGHRWAGRTARQVLTALLLLRLRLQHTAVVRTVHNVELPQNVSGTQRALLRRFDEITTLRIHLNPHSPALVPGPAVVIPHGHYRSWYDDAPQEPARRGHLVYFGLVRRYKGVEGLVRAFRDLEGEHLRLTVAGRPTSDAVVHDVENAADGDERVDVRWGFLSDDELARTVTSGQLVVLPYRFMHNSGAVLAALSLDRPVLVPDTPVNRDLAEEVGRGWVHTYTGELDADDLRRALAAVAEPRASRPDLSARDWDRAASEHLAAYRTALRRALPDAPGARTPERHESRARPRATVPRS